MGAKTPESTFQIPAKLRPLFDIGRDVLGARDRANLHVLLERHSTSVINALTPLLQDLEFNSNNPPAIEDPDENDSTSVSLGVAVANRLAASLRDSIAVSSVLMAAAKEMLSPSTSPRRRDLLEMVLSDPPAVLRAGKAVPRQLSLAYLDVLKGSVAFFAAMAACVEGNRIEPWLASALVEAFEGSVRRLAWLAAGLGYPTGVGSSDTAVDLALLFQEAQDADQAFLRRFEDDVRHGRTGVPQDQ